MDMKRFSLSSLVLLITSLGLALPAYATVPPTLALTATGGGDSVQISVNGDPNVSVLLSFTQAGSGPQIVSLGTTDGNGAYTQTVSSATYGLTTGTPVNAILNGTGGPRSPTVSWPTVTSSNALSLSQSAVVVNAASSVTITASNIGSGSLYVSSNSNASVANVSINGAQIGITGNIAGTTTVSLCQVGNTTTCPSIYVTVLPAGASLLTLSQNNVTVVNGQNLPITVSGGNGAYQIMNNTNASVIQASISGSVLTLSTGSTSGSATVTVCSTDAASCNVVVATAASSSSVAVTFSTTAPIVSVNQSTTVNVYGPSGVSFYVSSNSNPSIVQANLSGSTLTLTGIANGNSVISVCASTSTCANLTVTVQDVANGGNIAINQNKISILSGQNTNVLITGGTQPYFTTGGATSIAQLTLNGGTLTVYGVSTGTANVNVCSAGGGCVILTVNVNGGGTTPTGTTGGTTTPTPTPVTTPSYTFTKYLTPGSSGDEVMELQKMLSAQGLLTATPNGYFGPSTKAAVIKFQASHGLTQLGAVGPATREVLNHSGNSAAPSGTTGSNTNIANMSLAELRAQVLLLQAQLTQVLNRITQLSGQ